MGMFFLFIDIVQEWLYGWTVFLDSQFGRGWGIFIYLFVIYDGDDNYGNEEDQVSRRGVNDEWQFFLDVRLVFSWGESIVQRFQVRDFYRQVLEFIF